MNEEVRKRIMGEVMRLRAEYHNCDHCKAILGQMSRLYDLLPPEPVEANGMRYTYCGPMPPIPEELKRRIGITADMKAKP